MENSSQNYFNKALKYLLFATAFTPWVVTHSTVFPFITGKVFFFRGLVEIALILFILQVVLT